MSRGEHLRSLDAGPCHAGGSRRTDGQLDSWTEEPIDEAGWADAPIDWVALDSAADLRSDNELLKEGAPLDSRRKDVPVSDLYPDRLQRAGSEKQRRLEAAYRADSRPEAWIGLVNPVTSDRSDRGRLENCADCARAFQAGLDGRPIAAASILPRGLGLAGKRERGGEHPAYTEQWAGQRAIEITYDELGRSLADSGGSAILFGWGPGGGHAFNAYFDADLGRVRWADAQNHVIGNWPPDELSRRLPDCRAILFERRDR